MPKAAALHHTGLQAPTFALSTLKSEAAPITDARHRLPMSHREEERELFAGKHENTSQLLLWSWRPKNSQQDMSQEAGHKKTTCVCVCVCVCVRETPYFRGKPALVCGLASLMAGSDAFTAASDGRKGAPSQPSPRLGHSLCEGDMGPRAIRGAANLAPNTKLGQV